MRITRRHLQLALATLWLLDAALQCQPAMFTAAFSHRVLAPAASGQPAAVAVWVHWAALLVASHPLLANGGFALVQAGLGLGLLTRRFTRELLAASVAWSVCVWVAGEGLGGIATGATLASGAPGAALLYAVLALLAWPTSDDAEDQRPSWLAIPAWCGLWLTGAVLQLLGGNGTGASISRMLRAAAPAAPGWIAALDARLARLGVPTWGAAGLLALDVLIATWALVPGRTRRASVALGVVVALLGWLLVQGLGDLTSGQATDVNAGPLVALLGLAVLGASAPRSTSSAPRRTTRRPTALRIAAPSLAGDHRAQLVEGVVQLGGERVGVALTNPAREADTEDGHG